MHLIVFAPPQFALEQVAKALQAEGLSVSQRRLGKSDQALPAHYDVAILIFPELDAAGLCEVLPGLRNRLGTERRLIVCCPQFTPADRALLADYGAREFIAPRAWTAAAVTERILAETIVADAIQPTACGLLKGATAPMRKLYEEIKILAPLNEPILILGETGAGKELVAHELHALSGRAGELSPINCPAINQDLFASELFGHAKGAFTNAVQPRQGLLAGAGTGTVFLDEIGDLNLETQVKLLRVLEERRVRRVGSNEWEKIPARIVLATNRDLVEDVEEKKFRSDLFERLQGFTLYLPALRERRADLPLLAQHFVTEYNQEYKKQLRIPPGALDCLFYYEWPGNVRELRAAVRKAAAFASSPDEISTLVLLESVRPRKQIRNKYEVTFDPATDTLATFLERAEKRFLRETLAVENGNKVAAAKRAGISRSHLYEKLKLKETDDPS